MRDHELLSRQGQQGAWANGHTANEASSNGVGPSNPQNGDSPNGKPSPTGGVARRSKPTFYGHDREEVTRILIQGLNDLGYAGAAGALSRESGYSLETPYAAAFRSAILSGDWAEAEDLLIGTFAQDEELGGVEIDDGPGEQLKRDSAFYQPAVSGLPLSDDADRGEMLFLIRRQKYLELLERMDPSAALVVLREELQPLQQDERQLHALSSLIMCETVDDLMRQAQWDGSAGESRRQLLTELSGSISPSVMIPERRLARLLTHVKDDQVTSCLYHNVARWPSLYFDHHCERDDLPLETLCMLNDHQDEVWFLQFSHDGTRLATASRDSKVMIYDMTEFKVIHQLADHSEGVAYVSWSPDDARLVTCSQDKKIKVWNTQNGTCIRSITWHGADVTTAAWNHDSQTFATGSHDRERPLAIWARTPHPQPIHAFYDCARVQDVAITSPNPVDQIDPTTRPVRLLAVCVDKTIHIYHYATREKLSKIKLDFNATSLSVSSDGLDMLVNLQCDEVWAIGLDSDQPKIKYKGQKQGSYVIRSCFGGASEGFVVSGGEDSKISIWHRHTGKLLEKFAGHRDGCVNAVSWNKTRPGMFASAGDDHVVRIWAKPSTLSPFPALLSSQHSQNSGEGTSGNGNGNGTGLSSPPPPPPPPEYDGLPSAASSSSSSIMSGLSRFSNAINDNRADHRHQTQHDGHRHGSGSGSRASTASHFSVPHWATGTGSGSSRR